MHYMYYGPYSVYQMSGMIGQQPSVPYAQSYFATPPAPSFPQEESNAPRNIVRSQSEKEPLVSKIPEDRGYTATRGRPPKDRRR